MHIIGKNYKNIIFFEKDLTKSSGYSYIYSYYSSFKKVKLVKSGKYELNFIQPKYKLILIFLILPFLYLIKILNKILFSKNNLTSQDCDTLIVGHPSAFMFIAYLLKLKTDVYTVDTLFSYYEGKSNNFFIRKLILFIANSIDRYILFASNSNYFLNTYSKRLFQKLSISSTKIKSLPVGIKKNKILLLKKSFSLKKENEKNIGIYSNFLYIEHQVFMNNLIKCFNDDLINFFRFNYKVRLAGLYSEELLKAYSFSDTKINEIFISDGYFDSLVKWLAKIDFIIIPFITTCGIKIKVLEALASCRPVMINSSLLEHIPQNFTNLYPSIFFYSDLNRKTIYKFIEFSNEYYSSSLYKKTSLNLYKLDWENMSKN
tara:strand:+ start:25593 stop:26711 length:1119 start_codon:yes stop_codon:yes gene_type:complete